MLSPQPLPVSVGQALGPLSGLFRNNLFCHCDCITHRSPSSLCSSLTNLLKHTSRFLPQGLALAIPSAWHVPGAPSLTSFRSLLKCHLLSTAFLDTAPPTPPPPRAPLTFKIKHSFCP